LNDYSNIEQITHVPTNTYSRKTAQWKSFFGNKRGYQQVIYDTTPTIESDITKEIGSYSHPSTESMKNWSPLFFRLKNGWMPIKKRGGLLNKKPNSK
jgi:hypothetical protein